MSMLNLDLLMNMSWPSMEKEMNSLEYKQVMFKLSLGSRNTRLSREKELIL